MNSQKFRFEYQEEGYYKITVIHTGKSLTVNKNEIKEGSAIVQNDYSNLDSQKWILIDSHINGWIIAPLQNVKLALTIKGESDNNSEIILKNNENTVNQMFYIYNTYSNKKTNGIYKIAIGKDPNKVFNVLDGKKDNLINLNILDYNDTIQQKFYFEYQKEGFYKIVSMNSGKSLMVKDNIVEEKKEIVQYHYMGLDSQKWILRDSHIAGWVISPLSNPELAITVEGNIKNNSKLILDKVKDDDNQMLYIFNISKQEQKQKNGIYKLAIGKDSSKTVEVLRGDKYNGATVDIYDYVGNPQQKFYLEYQDEGFYKITAMHTGKSLTVKDGNIEKETEIVQFDYQGLDSQKWILRDSHINGWVISPLHDLELAITIDQQIQNGSKLVLKNEENNDFQMMYIINISKEEQKHENGIYKIAIGIDSKKMIEIENGLNANDIIADIRTFRRLQLSKIQFCISTRGIL